MIREICKDETFLAQKAAPATAADLGVAQDLMETLIAHKDGCVGMAANMIGVNKRIIAFENDGEYMVMFNPVILKKSGPYETEEGCLSLTAPGRPNGSRPSRCSGRTKSSSPASRPSQAGQQRSSSTSSTTATASLFDTTGMTKACGIPQGFSAV